MLGVLALQSLFSTQDDCSYLSENKQANFCKENVSFLKVWRLSALKWINNY